MPKERLQMKKIKIIIAISLLSLTGITHAGSSSNGRSDEGSRQIACMIPVHTNDYYQFLNANMIRYVRIAKTNEEMVRILYAGNTSDNTINIVYNTKEEALAAANRFITAINNCGKSQ
jgi:hypothetical protein